MSEPEEGQLQADGPLIVELIENLPPRRPALDQELLRVLRFRLGMLGWKAFYEALCENLRDPQT